VLKNKQNFVLKKLVLKRFEKRVKNISVKKLKKNRVKKLKKKLC